MSEDKFCTKCGKKVPSDAMYCDKCGEPIVGSEAFRQREEAYANFEEMAKESRMMWIKFLLVIYAIPMLILAIYWIANIDWITDQMCTNADFIDWMDHHNITESDVHTYVSTLSYMALVSAICAALSFVCVMLRKLWIIAVIACILAAIFVCFSLFGILIGFLVAWMIISAKESFDDGPILKQKQE